MSGHTRRNRTRQLPRRVYLDTQFVFAYLVEDDYDHRAAEAEADGLKQLSRAQLVQAFISLLVLDELAWKLAGVLYDGAQRKRGAWKALSAKEKRRAYRRHCPDIADVVDEFLREPWIRVTHIGQQECRGFVHVLRQYRLCPADACHLACATHRRMGAIMSNDSDFRDLESAPVEILLYGGKA